MAKITSCPVCGSSNTVADPDFPYSMMNCDNCGSEWVNDTGEVLLHSRRHT